ncbi:MAG: fructose-bisphosphatase class III, partial [Selenomonas sp.]|nr:fructose-bisphosphatase class III [Selenomonas sp.]
MVRGTAVKGRPNKVMRLLAEKYPTKESVYEQLIYLQSRLSLPKGIEHFMS